jgi:hypothetical protein
LQITQTRLPVFGWTKRSYLIFLIVKPVGINRCDVAVKKTLGEPNNLTFKRKLLKTLSCVIRLTSKGVTILLIYEARVKQEIYYPN